MVIFRLIFELLFGGAQSASASTNYKNVQDGVGSKTAMHRIFSGESSLIDDLHQNDSTQESELGSKGDQRTIILSSGKIVNISRGGENKPVGRGKFSAGSKAQGAARARINSPRQQAANPNANTKSNRILFADALTVNPRYHSGRGQNQNGLFDPHNPGCAGGPRSITVLGQSKSAEQEGGREETDSEESNIAQTSNLFSADCITGNIQDIDVTFNHFKERMTQIGNQYTGEKKEYFFEQLNQCGIERFKDLSTEKGRLTIYGVREAETMLQSEFEGFHESNSITRPTDEEYQENNVFDGRLRKLSGKSNTLNEQYTEADAKLLVSEKTLEHQADERRRLGQKNPNKMTMYEQGKNMGSSIVGQKYKHCNPDKPELPSSPDNVKHIINAIELLPSETNIAKKGILNGVRSALSDKLKVPESSISDQTALQGIIFLNKEYTIECVN